MGSSPDGFLFYGYAFPDEHEVPDQAAGTYMDDRYSVQIGRYGRERGTPYVFWGPSQVWSADSPEPVDLAALAASLPASVDVDEEIRTFARTHGLPGPDEPAYPASDWDDSRTTAIGWWLVSHYG